MLVPGTCYADEFAEPCITHLLLRPQARTLLTRPHRAPDFNGLGARNDTYLARSCLFPRQPLIPPSIYSGTLVFVVDITFKSIHNVAHIGESHPLEVHAGVQGSLAAAAKQKNRPRFVPLACLLDFSSELGQIRFINVRVFIPTKKCLLSDAQE